MARLTGFVEGPRNEYSATEREQAKAMIADPSGNLIELKAYRPPLPFCLRRGDRPDPALRARRYAQWCLYPLSSQNGPQGVAALTLLGILVYSLRDLSLGAVLE